MDDELTYRQIEILKLIAQGRASKEIAQELGLSSKTVDVHRARIMERLNLNDIASPHPIRRAQGADQGVTDTVLKA